MGGPSEAKERWEPAGQAGCDAKEPREVKDRRTAAIQQPAKPLPISKRCQSGLPFRQRIEAEMELLCSGENGHV